MGLAADPYCNFCAPGTLGSFVHMVWECPGISELWGRVIRTLSDLMEVQLPIDHFVHLLNDDSKWSLTEKSREIWLAGVTAAKKIISTLESASRYLKDSLAKVFFGHYVIETVIRKD